MPQAFELSSFYSEEEESIYVTLNMIDHALRTFQACLNRHIRGNEVVRLLYQCNRTHDSMKTFLSFMVGAHPRVTQYVNTEETFIAVEETVLETYARQALLDPKSIFHVGFIQKKIHILQQLHRELQMTDRAIRSSQHPPVVF
jgi:hypothetical protein